MHHSKFLTVQSYFIVYSKARLAFFCAFINHIAYNTQIIAAAAITRAIIITVVTTSDKPFLLFILNAPFYSII
jgi:hypothetical protein